jgi:acyl carrier protein
MSSYEETLRITTEILRKHVAEGREIGPAAHIQTDLGLDSLGVMEVVADIEDRFGFVIPNEVLDSVTTPSEIARALVELQAAKGSNPARTG